jgi:penicillin-insensitive murein endopeptidase
MSWPGAANVFVGSVAALLAADAGPPAPAPDAGATTAPPPALSRGAIARQWQALRAPATGPALAIGTTSRGCLQGASTLPASGRGYEVIRLGRNRRYGHPLLVGYVERLGKAARKAKLGVVIVGDLSQPRGGPTPTGHRSHQTGLDADISYVAPAGVRAGRLSTKDRENASLPVVIDLKTHVTTAAWKPGIVKLLQLAATDATVDRIFVNPWIKKKLCDNPKTAKAPWQARLRPWRYHHDHFHVRLKCPADSPLCVPQPQPADDGCGATLAWWFRNQPAPVQAQKKETEAEKETEKDAEAPAPEPAAPEPALPDACTAVMERADERPALARASSRKREKGNPRKAGPHPGPPTHPAHAARAGEGEILGQR